VFLEWLIKFGFEESAKIHLIIFQNKKSANLIKINIRAIKFSYQSNPSLKKSINSLPSKNQRKNVLVAFDYFHFAFFFLKISMIQTFI